MPTSNRPVEPVVGMEYDSRLTDEPARYVVKAIDRDIIWSRHMLGDEQFVVTATMWREDVLLGRILPVLWTVGPRDRRTRLRAGELAVTCSQGGEGPAGCARCRNLLMLYPTRAAALAAGKAFGWSEPVARRVVRK